MLWSFGLAILLIDIGFRIQSAIDSPSSSPETSVSHRPHNRAKRVHIAREKLTDKTPSSHEMDELANVAKNSNDDDMKLVLVLVPKGGNTSHEDVMEKIKVGLGQNLTVTNIHETNLNQLEQMFKPMISTPKVGYRRLNPLGMFKAMPNSKNQAKSQQQQQRPIQTTVVQLDDIGAGERKAHHYMKNRKNKHIFEDDDDEDDFHHLLFTTGSDIDHDIDPTPSPDDDEIDKLDYS